MNKWNPGNFKLNQDTPDGLVEKIKDVLDAGKGSSVMCAITDLMEMRLLFFYEELRGFLPGSEQALETHYKIRAIDWLLNEIRETRDASANAEEERLRDIARQREQFMGREHFNGDTLAGGLLPPDGYGLG